jgi:hypothetical protein
VVLVPKDELWLRIVAAENSLAVIGDYAGLELVICLGALQLLKSQGQWMRLDCWWKIVCRLDALQMWLQSSKQLALATPLEVICHLEAFNFGITVSRNTIDLKETSLSLLNWNILQ